MAADYYKVLGVSRDASGGEIKSAFRRLARETHPDVSSGDSESTARFRAAAEAYEVLSDPDRRRRYDRGDTIDLSDLFQGFGGFEDILRSVFGDGGLFTGSAPTRPQRGRDVLIRTSVTLEQAAFGCDVEVEYQAASECATCKGTGGRPGSGVTTCETCGGAGQVRAARRSLFGTMMTVTDCPDCAGLGSVIDDPCPECGGAAVIEGWRTVAVEVPPGVSTGTRLRLTGRGEAVGHNQRAGDLHVELEVLDDPRFERHDVHLVHRIKIGFVDATLGSRLKIPLLDGGATDLEIPPATQPGSQFTIAGYGVPRLGQRGRGDLVVVVEVEIPSAISDDEIRLLREYARLRDEAGPPLDS